MSDQAHQGSTNAAGGRSVRMSAPIDKARFDNLVARGVISVAKTPADIKSQVSKIMRRG